MFKHSSGKIFLQMFKHSLGKIFLQFIYTSSLIVKYLVPFVLLLEITFFPLFFYVIFAIYELVSYMGKLFPNLLSNILRILRYSPEILCIPKLNDHLKSQLSGLQEAKESSSWRLRTQDSWEKKFFLSATVFHSNAKASMKSRSF